MHDRSLVAALGALGFGAADFGLFAVAGTAVDRDLALGPAYSWLFSAGAFAFAATLMPAGVAVNRLGAETTQRAGAVVALAGACCCVASSTAAWLLAGRVLMGVGGALLTTVAWNAIGSSASGGEGRFAASGVAIACGFAAGALLGGLPAAAAGWRAGFVPLCVALLPSLLLDARRPVASAPPAPPNWRTLGVAVPVLAAGAALIAPAPSLGALLLASGAAVGSAGLHMARRDGWLARDRGAWAALAAAAGVTASGVGAIVLVARALTEVEGRSPVLVALLLASFGLLAPIAEPLVSRAWPDAAGRGCAVLGLSTQVLGITSLVVFGFGSLVVAVALACAGLGHALANAGVAGAVLTGGHGGVGPASALLATAQYLGSGVGTLIVLGVARDPLTGESVVRGLSVAAALGLAGIAAAGAPSLHRAGVSQRIRARP